MFFSAAVYGVHARGVTADMKVGWGKGKKGHRQIVLYNTYAGFYVLCVGFILTRPGVPQFPVTGGTKKKNSGPRETVFWFWQCFFDFDPLAKHAAPGRDRSVSSVRQYMYRVSNGRAREMTTPDFIKSPANPVRIRIYKLGRNDNYSDNNILAGRAIPRRARWLKMIF